MPLWSQRAAADPLLAIGLTDVVPIASGGFSVVYRAQQPELHRLVALKVLTLPVGDDRGRRRFERELALAGRLTGHPNVVSVFGSGFLADGRGYVMMEYCPGGSLAERLANEGTLPVRDVVSIGVKICGVLELAAREGIVHRDVKPGNILVTRFGEPALSDFGVAVAHGEAGATTTARGLTPAHAAPEMLEPGEVGPPTDQWALASTLYTLLAGRPPFAAEADEGMLAAMLRVLSDPVPAIPRGDLPAGLQSTLERAMAKVPGERWPSAGDFGRALAEIERGAGWAVTPLPDREVPDAHPGGPDPWGRGGAGAGGPGARGAGVRDTEEDEPFPGRVPGPPAGIPPARLPVSGEATQTWAKRATPPGEEPAPASAGGRRRRWLVGGAVAVVVLVAAVAAAGVLVSRRSPAPKPASPEPTLAEPSAALAAKLAPRDVEVANEQPTTVTIRWHDPNDGAYPFVVRWAGEWHTASGKTQTVVEGLDPSKGYCFVVGAVYGVGGQTADAAPVCIRGATPPPATR